MQQNLRNKSNFFFYKDVLPHSPINKLLLPTLLLKSLSNPLFYSMKAILALQQNPSNPLFTCTVTWVGFTYSDNSRATLPTPPSQCKSYPLSCWASCRPAAGGSSPSAYCSLAPSSSGRACTGCPGLWSHSAASSPVKPQTLLFNEVPILSFKQIFLSTFCIICLC